LRIRFVLGAVSVLALEHQRYSVIEVVDVSNVVQLGEGNLAGRPWGGRPARGTLSNRVLSTHQCLSE
jgi:hypothetical protein